MSEQLKKTGIKIIAGRGCLVIAGILFLLFLCRYNQVEKTELYETEGRSFVKAEVTSILKDNEFGTDSYIGNQEVMLKVLSGRWKGKEMEAISSSSFLYGAHCEEGSRVVAIVSESNGEFTASVYSIDREIQVYLIVAIFALTIILIGGKQGLASVIGLAFTFLCIIFLFLPMIYRGNSPVFSAVVVVIIT